MEAPREDSRFTGQKSEFADFWFARLDEASLTLEQKKEATKVLLYLLRARRAHREAWAAIDKAKRLPNA